MPGAVLDIEAPGTTLRMASTPAGFTSIVGWRGAVTMAGAADKPLTITSWDPGAEGPDRVSRDGRAYIRDVGAALTLRFVRAGALGFWSGRTGGIALTGLQESAATGAISDTEISDNHYGLFTSDVNKLTVTATTFRRSELAGVLLHRGTANVVVERSTAEANGADGFVADRGSEAITLRQISAVGNAGDGIRFNGAPIAEDAGPAGASNVPHRDFRLENSVVRDNRDDGVQATDTDQLVIAGNQVIGHNDGIVVTGRSPGAQITGNTVRGVRLGGHRGAERPVRRGGQGQPHRRRRDRPPGPGRPGRPAGQRGHRRHEPRRLGRRRGGRLDRRGELPRGRGRQRGRRRPGDATRGRHRRSERRRAGGTSRSRYPSTCRT